MPRGETQAERPLEAKQPATPEALKGVAWQRIASKSQPGRYYYFNPATGQTEMKPPVVEALGALALHTLRKCVPEAMAAAEVQDFGRMVLS